MNLIEYEFWKEEKKWYEKIFNKVFEKNLALIREEIALRILQIDRKSLNWLDVGTGDGFTLFEILKYINKKKNLKINLTIIEPSPYINKDLRKRLSKLKNVRYKIINSQFNFNILKRKYDCIVLCHSNYYLANSKRNFKKLYKKLYIGLNKKGVLLVQSIAEDSDFQIIGKPKYSKWALGDKTYKIFRKLWNNVQFKKMPTYFDVTCYLSNKLTKNIKEQLLHLYRFMTQKNEVMLNEKQLKIFVSKIRRLSKVKNNRYFLDFKDCVISIQRD